MRWRALVERVVQQRRVTGELTGAPADITAPSLVGSDLREPSVVGVR